MAAASGVADLVMENSLICEKMLDNFVVYRKYPSTEHAQALIDLLKLNEIAYSVETTAPTFDATFAQNQRSEEVVIKLNVSDFQKADALQEQLAADNFNDIEKDHCLFDFTDQELIEVVVKPYEWSPFDYKLAQKILQDRGKEIPADIVTAIKKKEVEDASRTEVAPNVWVWAGYILALMGGLLGFFIGWHLSSHSKILPNGQIVKVYDDNVRHHGQRIMIIGAFCIITWLFIRLGFQLFI